MDTVVYCVICPDGSEHETAYKLLAFAAKQEFGMTVLPDIEREPGGKPFFPEYPDLHFNVSHSHGAAVCALHDKPVGVDVEKVRKAPRRLAQGQDDVSFFKYWTCKEATIKCQGRGIGALLSPIAISPECRTFEDVLPGWIITVCPTEAGEVRMHIVDAAEFL